MNEHPTDRRQQRYSLSVPVEFGGSRGITRNVSLGGNYFETAACEVAPGTAIHFALMFAHENQVPMRLDCEGTVVRVEELSGGRGIAATIDCYESIAAAIRPSPSPSPGGTPRAGH